MREQGVTSAELTPFKLRSRGSIGKCFASGNQRCDVHTVINTAASPGHGYPPYARLHDLTFFGSSSRHNSIEAVPKSANSHSLRRKCSLQNWITRIWPSLLDLSRVVKPETILRWHRSRFKAIDGQDRFHTPTLRALTIALGRTPPRLRVRGSDRALLVCAWMRFSGTTGWAALNTNLRTAISYSRLKLISRIIRP